MNPKIQVLKKLLPGFIPLFVFIAADEIWGTAVGLITGVSVGIIEFIYSYIRNKIIDKFVLADTLLLVVLGGVSLLSDNDIFFKLKPAFIQTIFCFVLGYSVFSGTNLIMTMSRRYMKDIQITEDAEQKMKRSLRNLFFIFSIHTLVVYYSAFYLSKEAWVFISGGLFYLIFGIYFIYELIINKIKKNKITDEEMLPIVDEDGKVLGQAPRSACHQNKNLLHPVVHLHIIDSKGNIYLQKRAENKLIQPGKWDTAVGGHIAAGEDLETALLREAKEEIGIENFKYRFIRKYVWESEIERELVFIFTAVYNGTFTTNPNEVSEGKFWSRKDIVLNKGKDIFTPNFIHEFSLYSDLMR